MENTNQNNDLKVGDENPVNRTSTKISIELTELEIARLQGALSEAVMWNDNSGYSATAESIRDLKKKFKEASN